jgi:predicted nucleotidyltransferase
VKVTGLPPADESRIAACLADSRYGVIAGYVFGSAAEDRMHRDSDIDIGVLLDRSRFRTSAARFDIRLALLALLPSTVGGREIDLVILNDCPPTLARHIIMDGRRLVCLDATAVHAFRRMTLSRAADLIPFLRRTRRAKLQSLRS